MSERAGVRDRNDFGHDEFQAVARAILSELVTVIENEKALELLQSCGLLESIQWVQNLFCSEAYSLEELLELSPLLRGGIFARSTEDSETGVLVLPRPKEEGVEGVLLPEWVACSEVLNGKIIQCVRIAFKDDGLEITMIESGGLEMKCVKIDPQG